MKDFNPHMDSNKYRRVQSKVIELDDAAKNELGEDMYNMVRTRLIDPLNAFLFQLHHAYEEGRRHKEIKARRRKTVRRILKEKPDLTGQVGPDTKILRG